MTTDRPSPALHVVLGASGGAGNAITRALLATAHDVRGVCRSGVVDLDGVEGAARAELLAADLTDPDQAKRAVHGADVVYMAVQPAYDRWAEDFPPMIEGVIGAVAAVGAKLVMVDNLYGYGPVRGPMREDTPERAGDKKGTVRRAMTERLLQAHRDGELRVAIGRASDYLGPRADNSAIAAVTMRSALAGRGPIRWMGSLDRRHSVAYLPDVAAAFVVLGSDARADGRVWHLPHAPAPTGREFVAMVNEVMGTRRRASAIGRSMLLLVAPFHAPSRESLGILHQWTQDFVVDDSAFHDTFGAFPITPLPEAIAITLEGSRR